jgi:hypothetical protein
VNAVPCAKSVSTGKSAKAAQNKKAAGLGFYNGVIFSHRGNNSIQKPSRPLSLSTKNLPG